MRQQTHQDPISMATHNSNDSINHVAISTPSSEIKKTRRANFARPEPPPQRPPFWKTSEFFKKDDLMMMRSKPNEEAEEEEEEEAEVVGASPTHVEVQESGRDRLKRHRVEVAGRVWIPDVWGQEDLLKDWIDCTVFDASLGNKTILSARAALVEEGRTANSGILTMDNSC